jgi:hypothetical protein
VPALMSTMQQHVGIMPPPLQLSDGGIRQLLRSGSSFGSSQSSFTGGGAGSAAIQDLSAASIQELSAAGIQSGDGRSGNQRRSHTAALGQEAMQQLQGMDGPACWDGGE